MLDCEHERFGQSPLPDDCRTEFGVAEAEDFILDLRERTRLVVNGGHHFLIFTAMAIGECGLANMTEA